MRKFYTLLLVCIASLGFAQTLPLDFETEYAWTDFDGGGTTTVANPHSDAENSSANVGQMIKSDGQPWGGSFLTLAGPIDFTGFNAMTMKVYAHHPAVSVLLKVENSANPAENYEQNVTLETQDAWETVEFDFGGINPDLTYDRIVVIFDLGTVGDGSNNFTYFFDDIALGNSSSSGIPMELPVTFDLSEVDYSLIGFGGAENSSVVTNPYIEAPNETPSCAQVVKAADAQTWAGTVVAPNSGLASAIPFAAGETKMKVMVWSPDAGIPIRLKVENHADGAVFCETETMNTVAEAWEQIEFDFANPVEGSPALDFAETYDKPVIFFNFGTDGATAGEKTYYFDTLEFGAIDNAGVDDITANSEISFYPNPAISGAQITFSDNVESVDFYNLNGQKVQTVQGNTAHLTVPAGMYLLQITDDKGNASPGKLLVK